MANQTPLVLVSGVLRQLPSADMVAAAGFFAAPKAYAYAASITLDAAAANDFAIGLLTGNVTTLTFANAAAGRQGTVWAQQDATGSRTIAWSAPSGFTLKRDLLAADLNPQAAASSITLYSYAFVTLNAVGYLLVGKSFLT